MAYARTRSSWMTILLVASAHILFLPAIAPAATLRWTRTVSNMTPPDNNRGYSIATAPDGSIYLLGTYFVAGQSGNILLQKYSPSGTLRWTRTYTSAGNLWDIGNGIAVAPDGNIYVVGTTVITVYADSDILLMKYSPSGTLLWTRTYNGEITTRNEGFGVAVSPDGRGIYITGYTFVEGQAEDVILLKYSPSGALRWTRTYNGMRSRWDEGFGVAVAADGNIYVTGFTFDGQRDHLLLQKYSPFGALRWTKTYSGGAGGRDDGFGVAAGADGGIYVTGLTYVEGESNNLLLQKYSPTGNLRWTKTYNGGAGQNDMGWSIASAPGGGILVAGDTHESPDAQDVLLRKHSLFGGLRWGKTYNGTAGLRDSGRGVAAAIDGSIYISVLSEVSPGSYDLLLLKYK